MRIRLNTMHANAGANLAGRLWSAALNLLSVPLVVKALGMEAFGLVSFVAVFTTLTTVFDLGLATTINREAARLKSLAQENAIPRLLRTFETIYWIAGCATCIMLVFASQLFAEHWIVSATFTTEELHTVLLVAAFSIAIRWPTALYAGFLQGCQRQVLGNAVQAGVSTLRTVAGLAVIYFLFPTVKAFLWCQVAVSIAEVLFYCLIAWNVARGISPARALFCWDMVGSTWRFALGYSAIGMIGLLFSTSDRFILARCLPLSQLGEYNIASTACGVITLIGISIGSALFPVLSAHYAAGNDGKVWKELRNAAQLMSVATLGLLCTIVLFGNEIVRLWTRQEGLAIYASPVLALLGVAAFCNALQVLLGSALTAAGINDAVIKCNTAALVLVVPLNAILIPRYGLEAAAGIVCAWQAGFTAYLAYRVSRHLGIGRQQAVELLQGLKPYLLLAAAASLVLFFGTRRQGLAWTTTAMCGTLLTYYVFVFWRLCPRVWRRA